jgi:hypothetical protein
VGALSPHAVVNATANSPPSSLKQRISRSTDIDDHERAPPSCASSPAVIWNLEGPPQGASSAHHTNTPHGDCMVSRPDPEAIDGQSPPVP